MPSSKAFEGIWTELKENFDWEEVNDNNHAFKVVSQFSAGICLVATALLTLDSYVGSTIDCVDDNGVAASKVVHEYCWIHGTKYFPEYKWKDLMKKLQETEIDDELNYIVHKTYNPFCYLHEEVQYQNITFTCSILYKLSTKGNEEEYLNLAGKEKVCRGWLYRHSFLPVGPFPIYG